MKTFLFLLLLAVGCSYPQIKVTWQPDSQNLWYNVYYCAGDDSSKFPLKENSLHSDVWDWQSGSTLYPYFYIKNDGYGKYYRVGVIGISPTGDMSAMSIQTYERKKAIKPLAVRIQEVKE